MEVHIHCDIFSYSFFRKAFAQDNTISILVKIVIDKIRCRLLEQILGNLNGLPQENSVYQ